MHPGPVVRACVIAPDCQRSPGHSTCQAAGRARDPRARGGLAVGHRTPICSFSCGECLGRGWPAESVSLPSTSQTRLPGWKVVSAAKGLYGAPGLLVESDQRHPRLWGGLRRAEGARPS